MSTSRAKAAKVFGSGVFASKFLILALLLWLSYITSYTTFVANNPNVYLTECIVMGACTALSIAFIAFTRMQSAHVALNAAMLAFLVFFVFQTLLEFSGLNQASAVSTTATIDAVTSTKTKWLLIPLGILFVGLGLIAAWVRDGTGYTNGKIGGWPQLLVEAIVLGIGGAVPVMMVAIDRGASLQDSVVGGLETGVMFAALHGVLQAGGFYTHVFPNPPTKSV